MGGQLVPPARPALREEAAIVTTVILKGQEAIHYAEIHHLELHKYADETGAACNHLSLEEARDLVEVHPESVWVETHVAVNSADPDELH